MKSDTIIEHRLANYPAILSSEQLREILHFSKRKIAWLLQHQYIKCEVSDKKTRRYKVCKEDLIFYINHTTIHPEQYRTPEGCFSSKKSHQKSQNMLSLEKQLPQDYRDWLELQWCDEPDVFTTDGVAYLTGYTHTTIMKWVQKGLLNHIKVQEGIVIAKEWVIDFYCTYGYSVKTFSPLHRELLHRYFTEKSTSSNTQYPIFQ